MWSGRVHIRSNHMNHIMNSFANAKWGIFWKFNRIGLPNFGFLITFGGHLMKSRTCSLMDSLVDSTSLW